MTKKWFNRIMGASLAGLMAVTVPSYTALAVEEEPSGQEEALLPEKEKSAGQEDNGAAEGSGSGQETDQNAGEIGSDEESEGSGEDKGGAEDSDGAEADNQEEKEEEQESAEDEQEADTENLPEGKDKKAATEKKVTYRTGVSFPDGFEGFVDDGAQYCEGGSETLLGVGSTVNLDLTGTFFTYPADKILNQINEIRYEACSEGIYYSRLGRNLTMDDYHPLQWSYELERSTRIRAMEAGMTIAHQALDGGDIYHFKENIPGVFFGWGENLAWNNNHDASGITYGINQFYNEKSEYLRTLEWSGATGHYLNLINPNYRYVGVGCCMMSGTPYGWNTLAMQLGVASDAVVQAGTVDTTKDNRQGKLTYSIPVKYEYFKELSISGADTVLKGEQTEYSAEAKITVSNGYGGTSGTYAVSDSNKGDISWSSSDEDIFTVDAGVVTGLMGGTATLTGKIGSVKGTKTVKVIVPLEGIKVTEEGSASELAALNINRNEITTKNVSVSYLPEDTTDEKKASFSSSNTGVVSVDSSGKLTFKKPGDAVITVTAKSSNKNMGDNGTITRTFSLHVTAPVTAITLSKKEMTLNYTGSTPPNSTLTVSFRPSDTEYEKKAVFSSSDESIAVVDQNGKVTAVAGGSAVITASAYGFTDSCLVSVSAPLKSMEAKEEKAKLYLPDTRGSVEVTLTPLYTSDKEVVFTSLNPESVRLTDAADGKTLTVTAQNGIARAAIEGVSAGNADAKIEISAAGGRFTKTVEVVIAKPAESVAITLDDEIISEDYVHIMTPGSTIRPVAQVSPADCYDTSVTWTSSNPDLVQVSQEGVVTALREGEAVITATSYNAPEPISASFTVAAYRYIESVALSTESVELYEGDEYLLRAYTFPEGITDEDGRPLPVYFESSDSDVAEVAANGTITALSQGSATITAVAVTSPRGDVLTKDCRVVVKRADYNKDGLPDSPITGDSIDGIWLARDCFGDCFDEYDDSRPVFKYTGKAIKPESIRLYYKKTLLTENVDYTVSYKNNVKRSAREDDVPDTKRPQLTVKLKGQYSGSRTYYYYIDPVDLETDEGITTPGMATAVYNGKKQEPVPVLYYNGTALKNKTDFTCTYSYADEHSFIDEGVYDVHIEGKGNFTGDLTLPVAIVKAGGNFAKASVTISPKKVLFTGGDLGLTAVVKISGKEVSEEYYRLNYVSAPGNVVVTVVPTAAGEAAGFYGFKQLNVKAAGDRSMKDVDFYGVDNQIFDASLAQRPEGITLPELELWYGGDRLTEGTDYTLTYGKNNKTGSVNVTATGLGRYTGTAKKSFKILPNDGSEMRLRCNSHEVSYTKGGAEPDITLTDHGVALTPKTDYVVSVASKSNLKPGTMTFTVTGKGNYKGYTSAPIQVAVTNGDLKQASLTLQDKVYSTKKDGWKSSVKITDKNGKALAAGTDYDKQIVYSYSGMDTNPYPEAGTVVFVTVIGKGAYEGSAATGSYRIYEKGIDKVAVVVESDYYNGRPVEPGMDKIHIYPTSADAKNGNELRPTENYCTILGYDGNTKAGNGKITLKGKGMLGGTKTFSFKILKPGY